MKKSILLSTIIYASCISASAAVINVSNSPTSPINPPHTYNNLQTAITAAADGDSLYVHGTNIDYGAITINNKTLTLIGAGYGNNLQSNFQQKSHVQSINFDGFTGTKNVTLVGLFIPNGIATVSPGAPVNNLYIERCGFLRISSESNNLIVRQCVIEAPSNVSIFQPIVTGSAIIQNSVLSGNVGDGNVNNSYWENNIFKKNDYYYHNNGSISTYNGNATFVNNIFNFTYQINVSNCTFNNNVLFQTNGLTNGNSGTGNLTGDPALKNNPNLGGANEFGIENYATAVDFRLAAGSQSIGAGFNGVDIGIYGGVNALPLTNNLNGVPAMPRVTEMNVQNISVAPNGNLNVQIKAIKEN